MASKQRYQDFLSSRAALLGRKTLGVERDSVPGKELLPNTRSPESGKLYGFEYLSLKVVNSQKEPPLLPGTLKETNKQSAGLVTAAEYGKSASVPNRFYSLTTGGVAKAQRIGFRVFGALAAMTALFLTTEWTNKVGMDGITLHDLKCMPRPALQALCGFFDVAEQTGCWPTQLLQGRVSPLAKTETPSKPDDYRPITIFPVLYRAWGTWHARHAIRALDQFLSLGLYGSRPHRYAAQVWSKVLWCIEEAFHSEFVLSGCIADLTKAFNLLPREIVMEGLALMGLPFPVLKAWSGALANMQRFFQVHGCFGRPQLSTCGYPEGCALSCVAMMLIDELLHRWLAVSHPLVQTLTYADDWQLVTSNGEYLPEAFDRVLAFCDAIRVPIDDRKNSFLVDRLFR